eukprot:3237980-Amphidinium_carterae.1
MSWSLVQRKGKRPQDRDIQLNLADLKAALLGGIDTLRVPLVRRGKGQKTTSRPAQEQETDDWRAGFVHRRPFTAFWQPASYWTDWNHYIKISHA